MKTAKDSPTTAAAAVPERDPVDFQPVLFPGWLVRYYDDLCEVYGWRQGFAEFLYAQIEPQVRQGLESRTGQVMGLPATLMALACQSLPTRELDAVTACARAEASAYEREIARRTAAAPDPHALLSP